jgi:hypothetical protein
MKQTTASPDSTKDLKLGMTGFVDDSNAHTTGRPEETVAALALRCTHDAQLWHDILWATGGAPETSKCSYQSMRFDFSGAGSPFLRHGKHGPPIVIKDATGSDITIEQLPVTQAYKILGTYQAANVSSTPYSKRKPPITAEHWPSAMCLSEVPVYTIPRFFCAALATPLVFATSPTVNWTVFKAQWWPPL